METLPGEEERSDAEHIARQHRQHILDAMKAMFTSMRQVGMELSADGKVDATLQRELQADVVSVITALWVYRNNDQIEWEKATPIKGGPDALLYTVIEGREVERPEQGTRGGGVTQDRDAARFDSRTLYVAALDLYDIASQLGFVAEPDERVEPASPDPV